jgi:hypothetical protein
MDFVATRTGNRTAVRLATRWSITHTEGAPLAHVAAPDGRLVGTLPISGAVPVTVNSLSAALLTWLELAVIPSPEDHRCSGEFGTLQLNPPTEPS